MGISHVFSCISVSVCLSEPVNRGGPKKVINKVLKHKRKRGFPCSIRVFEVNIEQVPYYHPFAEM